jgi:hypothetical protein
MAEAIRKALSSSTSSKTTGQREIEREIQGSDGPYDPWRRAYTPRLYEVVTSMTYANGPAIVIAINHRRKEAIIIPLKDEEWPDGFRHRREPFSMIRKFYDRSGQRKKKSTPR